MGIRDLFLDMHVSCLSNGDGGGAVRLAAVLAEAALKEILGDKASPRSMLGELIGSVHRDPEHKEKLGAALISDLNWLNERRKGSVHFKDGVAPVSVDEGKRCADIAGSILVNTGLCLELELGKLIREAEWKASAPASTSLLKLDRNVQRTNVDNLLGLQRRVIVVLLDGEVGQGHDHFGQVVSWRLRAVPKGQWREIKLTWPAPSSSASNRYAFLIESLCDALKVSVELPSQQDPLSAAGEQAWDEALQPLLETLARSRKRLYLRHSINWLSKGDGQLIEDYLTRVWGRVASEAGERLLISLEVSRAPASGLPLVGKPWRMHRRERRNARMVASRLENLEHTGSLRCTTLKELTSVTRDDLVQWFRNERDLGRSAAEEEAEAIIAACRGGRFELVVKRLAALTGK